MYILKQLSFILLLFPIFISAQCISGDCVSGIGEYKLKNGKYIGQFKDSRPHGNGVFTNRKGYSYDGEWLNSIKTGFGIETNKRDYFSYTGKFENNQRNGVGKVVYRDTRAKRNHTYEGEWVDGVPCGDGEEVFSQSKPEYKTYRGKFVNGLYQGRHTPSYDDELFWTPFNLSRDHFKMSQPGLLNLKKLKSPATIDGDISFHCECKNNILLINTNAIIKQNTSWWATTLPIKTISNVLSARQTEFDIIEWHARLFQSKINKEKFSCTNEVIMQLNKDLIILKKEMRRIIKEYKSETAWNPFKGKLKNPKPQNKWNKKVEKKLNKYEKINLKIDKKINKQNQKINTENFCGADVEPNSIPVFPEIKVEKMQEKNDVKKNKVKKSFLPTFPRSNQLE